MLCKYRKTTDKERILTQCIHGSPGARYDHKLGFTFSPDCEFCKFWTETEVKQ